MTALDRLFALEQFGIKLGLENIRALCSALGEPQRAYATLIVGGTNGKGSVTAMVDHALRVAGHRCARYTSPHLVRIAERFVIDGREVDGAELEREADQVLRRVDALIAAGTLSAPPTFFEATTALAFALFREARTEIAVLEVGLGGRLDATNVADALVSAITSIDRDHEEQLGGTLEQIAFEKAGIIKARRPVVLGPMHEAPRAVIDRVAAERGAAVVDATPLAGCRAVRLPGSDALELRTPTRTYPPVVLGLAGRHQAANALVAVRILEMLEQAGIAVGPDAIVRGLADVRWPGRLEWVPFEHGRLLLDAAHNPAGARSLAEYLAQAQVGPPMPLVFGAARDKNIGGMVEALAPFVSRVLATQAATPRARPAPEVAACVREAAPSLDVEIVVDPIQACRAALSGGDRATVAGSIFLVGEVRGRLAK